MIGRRVRKKFEDIGAFYTGHVNGYDPKVAYYKVSAQPLQARACQRTSRGRHGVGSRSVAWHRKTFRGLPQRYTCGSGGVLDRKDCKVLKA